MINPDSLNLFTRPEKPVLETPFTVALTIPTSLPYFDGHFPGNPVLPGVAIIDLSLEALRVHAEVLQPLVGMRSAKYLGMIQPLDKLTLNCTKNSENEWQVIWIKDGKKVSDLILNFG